LLRTRCATSGGEAESRRWLAPRALGLAHALRRGRGAGTRAPPFFRRTRAPRPQAEVDDVEEEEEDEDSSDDDDVPDLADAGEGACRRFAARRAAG
jgi:hypothetical protein